ncbi:MAG: serine/threonine protein kinase [Thiohalomonadales bacterium]
MRQLIGKQLDRYIIVDSIGEGSAGYVYEAEDVELKRRVAIKILKPERCTDIDSLERFKREARATASLDHPNIVKIHDVGQIDNRPYLVMELARGDTLSDLLNFGHEFSIDQICSIGIQLANAMSCAHTNDIVHRDIKPSNIICTLTYDNIHVKVTDFGIAYAVNANIMHKTEQDVIIGTPSYMSPEQFNGAKPDGRTDLYSIGVCLHELIAGTLPYAGKNQFEQALHVVKQERPAPLSSYQTGTPVVLCKIVDKLLEKKKEKRYQTGESLAKALKFVLSRYKKNKLRNPISICAKVTAYTTSIAFTVTFGIMVIVHIISLQYETNNIIQNTLNYGDIFAKQSAIPIAEESWRELRLLVKGVGDTGSILTLTIIDSKNTIRASIDDNLLGTKFIVSDKAQLYRQTGAISIYKKKTAMKLSIAGVQLPNKLLEVLGLDAFYTAKIPIYYQKNFIFGYVYIAIDQTNANILALKTRLYMFAVAIGLIIFIPGMLYLGRKVKRPVRTVNRSSSQIRRTHFTQDDDLTLINDKEEIISKISELVAVADENKTVLYNQNAKQL